MHFQLDRHLTPLATLLLVTDDSGTLRALDFADHEPRMLRLLRIHYGTFSLHERTAPPAITRALDAYFNGHLHALDQLPTATAGTPFQRQVWHALRNIPPATTQSYSQLAASLGRPAASRAVGTANSKNPIALIVPCHRIIGANGSLTGYAGGLQRKHWLLSHEHQHAPPRVAQIDHLAAPSIFQFQTPGIFRRSRFLSL